MGTFDGVRVVDDFSQLLKATPLLGWAVSKQDSRQRMEQTVSNFFVPLDVKVSHSEIVK